MTVQELLDKFNQSKDNLSRKVIDLEWLHDDFPFTMDSEMVGYYWKNQSFVGLPEADSMILVYPVQTWVDTDTEVGYYLMVLDDEPVATIYYPHRKNSQTIKWLSGGYNKVKNNLLALHSKVWVGWGFEDQPLDEVIDDKIYSKPLSRDQEVIYKDKVYKVSNVYLPYHRDNFLASNEVEIKNDEHSIVVPLREVKIADVFYRSPDIIDY